MTAGTALDQKTACQAICFAAAETVAESAAPTTFTTSNPTSEQKRMPTVSISWKTPAPLPRSAAGSDSAKYIGTTTPMRPAAIPCRARPE